MNGDHARSAAAARGACRGAARPGRSCPQGACRSDRRRPDGPGAEPGAQDSGGQAADRCSAAAGGRRRSSGARSTARCRGSRRAATTATSTFLAPLLDGVGRGGARRSDRALSSLDQIPANSLLGAAARRRAGVHPPQVPSHRRSRAVCAARDRLGRRAREPASACLRRRLPCRRRSRSGADDGRGHGIATPAAARQRILAGKPSGQAIDTAAKALERGADRLRRPISRGCSAAAPPIGLVQVARYANPQNSSATALLALLLDAAGPQPTRRSPCLRPIPRDDALISQVRDVQVEILDR